MPAPSTPRPPGPGGGDALADRAASLLARVTGALPGGEARPPQRQMARAVADAIERRRHLIVQAGTGTGKSLAYLVPAAVSGRPVVVATATKALQDQLGDKDLPQVASLLGRTFSFAVLKGRSNYLCRQRVLEIGDGALVVDGAVPLDTEPGQPWAGATVAGPDGGEPDGSGPTDAVGSEVPGGNDPGRLADQVRRIVHWAGTSSSGDRADLPFEPHARAWSMVSVGPRECPGAFRCPSGNECFAEAARDRAASADVVVVNTHLYGAHLASGGAVLPEHDIVVFDEAHEVEEVMTASLGAELSPGRLRALVPLSRPLVRRGPAGPLDDLAVLADRLQGELVDRVGQRVLHPTPGHPSGRRGPGGVEPGGRQRVRPGTTGAGAVPPGATGAGDTGAGAPGNDGAARDEQLQALLVLAATSVNEVAGELRRGQQRSLLDEAPDEGGRRGRALSAAGHLAEDLARILGRDDDLVAWVDGSSRAPVLRLSPIDVGPALAEGLWPEVTAVLTSATIPARTAERLGLADGDVDELDVGSPFDYRTHALLYVARHLPDRRLPESEAGVHEELAALIGAAGGRTLALFTSRRATEAAVAALRPRLDYPVLAQGELPKARLLEDFGADEASCLFATMSFWQGVDIPGRSLSLVTLDRLPFARPDEPLSQARRERAGDAAFRLVDLPRAATLLAQGVGRLVRAADDYGVVAVLDPRLATAGYRGVLLAGLPPMRRTTDRRQVVDFLTRVLDHHPGAPPGTEGASPGLPATEGASPGPAARRWAGWLSSRGGPAGRAVVASASPP